MLFWSRDLFLSPFPFCGLLALESKTVWVTQVSLNCLLFMWVTSDSVDFHRTLWLRLSGTSLLVSSAANPFQTFRWCCCRKHTCHFMFYQMLSTQHNERSSYSHYHDVTCIRASDAFELTVFKRLKGFKWYRKWSSGPLAFNFLLLCVGHKLRQRLTGSSAVTGHYSNWSHEYYNPSVSLQFWERTATQLSRTVTFISLMGTQHPLKASKCYFSKRYPLSSIVSVC